MRLLLQLFCLELGFGLLLYGLYVTLDSPGLEGLVHSDFAAFYGASQWLSGDGRPLSLLYDTDRFMDYLRDLYGKEVDLYYWFYPPLYLFLLLPLATFSLTGAYLLWVAGSLLMAGVTGWVMGLKRYALAMPLMPAAVSSTVIGQNGVLSALFLSLGLALLEKRPWLAGVAFAGLVYKPQYGLLIALALAAGRHWKSFLSAAVSVLAICLLSLLIHGVAAWAAFIDQLSLNMKVLSTDASIWWKMVTTYSFARSLGLGHEVALAAQAATALIAVAVVIRVWVRSSPLVARGASLAVGCFLLSPYGFYYDLALLLVPLAALMAEYSEGKRLDARGALAAVIWCAPALLFPLHRYLEFHLWPPLLLLLLWACVKPLTRRPAIDM